MMAIFPDGLELLRMTFFDSTAVLYQGPRRLNVRLDEGRMSRPEAFQAMIDAVVARRKRMEDEIKSSKREIQMEGSEDNTRSIEVFVVKSARLIL